ncbi:MAG TPA: SDR family oxidoreductase [Acidobacteriota bacterium]|jgi:NAD(P)-dependent dehydrogenase (short-subunit alcohol dehydrogenase family)|nr:SDR family oxidoreductase [Acidobacteriota bacterium]
MDLKQLTKLYDFTGRSAVITGATGVLCRKIAQTLVECGANVAILARNKEKGDALLTEIQGPGRAIIVPGDVLNVDSLREAAESVVKEFGRIGCLINGAGGNQPQATTGTDLSFFDLPEEALRYVFDLNVLGTILPTQIFAKRMARAGEGVILNISSMSALRPLTRVVGYSAAKAGVINFTQWLAVHLAQEYSPRIRVNAIAPGFFLTEQNRNLVTVSETGQLTPRGQKILEHTPMKRFGQPEDLLGTVLWLLSPASEFVTGIVVPIDGGFSAYAGV